MNAELYERTKSKNNQKIKEKKLLSTNINSHPNLNKVLESILMQRLKMSNSIN